MTRGVRAGVGGLTPVVDARASGLCSGRVGGIVSRWYRFAYRIGFRPWESDAPSMIPQFDQLLALVDETRAVPPDPRLILDAARADGR